MRAIQLHEFGAPLRVETIAEPEVGEGEELLSVAFAGVNPIDLWLSDGLVRGGQQTLPMVPGSDASGIANNRRVVVHGSGLGVTRDGLYAERAAVPVDAMVEIPKSVELEHAAAVGVPGSTAWILTHGIAEVSSNDRVLVLGCTGGVGSLLVQLGANAGARVTGHTSSPEKAEFVRAELRCDVVVADADGVADVVGSLKPTVVFDPLGNGYTAAVVTSIAPGTRIILYGTSAGEMAHLDLRSLYKKGASIRAYAAALNPPSVTRRALESILAELAAGRVVPFVDDIFPFEGAQAAHSRLRKRAVTGKLLLRP